MNQRDFDKLRREFRATGSLEPLYPILRQVVGAQARRLHPALSPSRRWDADGLAEALHIWIVDRLLSTNAVAAAFDHAASPGPFFSSLERSFRHCMLNRVERTELNNLRGRAEELLKGGDTRFHEWTYSGQPWWGLAEWVNHKVEPVTWAGRVEDLASLAWGAGEYAVLRYRSDVSRASPILSTSDLGDFLERLLRLAQRLIGRQQLTTVLRTRFNLVGDEAMQPLGDEDAASADTAEQAIEEAEADRIVALVLEEATPREFEAFRFYHGGATFEEVGALLSVSRGTAENDLKRIGSKIDRFRGDLSRRQVVEKLLDTLS